MKNKKRIFRVICGWMMTICMLISLMPVTFFADKTKRDIPEDAISISSAEDLLELAENCKVDAWSVGKTIVLKNDIDVSESEFKSIPTFGGMFLGNGFTIQGMELKGEGSVVGFFRYLQETAIVEGLHLEGTILPEGSQSIVGAIAGKNAGEINDCTFKGTVAGNEQIGGLVGVNETTGIIQDCSISGIVYGNHFIGGAAGENHGVIRNVTNNAEINTLSVQNTVALDDITIGSLINTENASTTTDIGGITGTNSGVLRSCKNHAPVGYQHMGYNIGGIAGRQSGYIVDCVNHADVQGRKEVGGIAGHVEPNVAVDFSEDGLEKLKEQLQVVEGSMSNLKNRVQKESTEMEQQMAAVEQELNKVQNATDTLIEAIDTEGTEKTKEDASDLLKDIVTSLDKLVALIEKLSSSLEDMDPQIKVEIETLLEEIEASIDNINETLESLDENSLSKIVTELDNIITTVNAILTKVAPEDSETEDEEGPYKKFSKKVTALQKELEALEKMLEALDFDAATEIIKSMYTRLTNLTTTLEKMSGLLEGVDTDTYAELNTLLTQTKNSLDTISKYLENPNGEALVKIVEELKTLVSTLSETSKKLSDLTADTEALGKEWNVLVKDFQAELKGLKEDLEKLEKIMGDFDLSEAGKTLVNITSLLSDLLKLAEEIAKSLELDPATKTEVTALAALIQLSMDNIDKIIEDLDLSSLITVVSELNSLMKTMSALTKALEQAYEAVEEATSEWESIFEDIGKETDAIQSNMKKLKKLLEDINVDEPKAAINDVGNSMGNLFDALTVVGDSMDASAENIFQALDDVVKQLEGAMGIVENFDETLQANIEDISDLDTVENTLGKIANSKNHGAVSGDYNIGGIVGLMGEESDFSTAEQIDVSGKTSLNIAYQMRAVVRGCQNTGTISANKQNVGGIVGQMLLGCVLESINLGNIDAIHADYVGGIAGDSETMIRNSSSKAIIAGDSYVGGIAGEANEITDCHAFIQIAAAKEKAGAIAGLAEKLPSATETSIAGNVFFIVGEAYGGIDGISYAGATDAVDLAGFLQTPNLDKAFKHVNIRFKAEGMEDVVKTIAIGESLSMELIPTVVVEEGEEFDWEFIPAVTSKVLGMGEIADVTYISEESLSNVLFDQTYEVTFDTKGSVVSAAERSESDLSILLAVGSFAKNTILDMQDLRNAEAQVNGKNAIVNYQVTLSNTGVRKLHFLLPQGVEADAVKLLVKGTSGTWAERTFVVEGSYIVFDFNSEDAGFALVSTSRAMFGKAAMMIGALMVVVLILSLYGKARKKKRK